LFSSYLIKVLNDIKINLLIPRAVSMNLAEFQGKLFFKENGIPIPEGHVARSLKDVKKFTRKMVKKGKRVILKPQLPVGGRGKAGLIERVEEPDEKFNIDKYTRNACNVARKHFGSEFRGYRVRIIYVEELLDISQEMYVAITYDDYHVKPLIMWSEEGGMDVEELAKQGKVQKILVDINAPEEAFAKIKNPHVANIAEILYPLQEKLDANLIEINPLARTFDGRILAVDSKIIIDPGAGFRHDFQRWRDEYYGEKPCLSELERMEKLVRELGIAYVPLDGNIGVIGNGAGLTMATLDTIDYYGGKPANFLDIGGGADKYKMINAIKLVLSNKRVGAGIFNIFGGITNCLKIADGIREMKKKLEKIPFGVRLSGYNYKEAIDILKEAGIYASANFNEVLSYVFEGLGKRIDIPIIKKVGEIIPRKVEMPGIFFDEIDEVIVQGITGRMGRIYTKLMKDYGTRIVAGVTLRKGVEEVHGVPTFNSVKDLKREHPDANASVVFIPAPYACSAVHDAIKYGIKTFVMIPENIPNWDTLELYYEARNKGVRLFGPNTPGIISPGEAMLGVIPYGHFNGGIIGMMSRSGTLTYEFADILTRAGYGQSGCVGIGGDRFNGTSFVECLEKFEHHPGTKAIVILEEIGGTKGEKAAEYISKHVMKPVVVYIAGRTAPRGERMGHAGAIEEMGMGSYVSKRKAFEKIENVTVVDTPEMIVDAVRTYV